MRKMTMIAIAAVGVLLVGQMARFTDKGTGAADVLAQALVTTEAECIERYSVPAMLPVTARTAASYCMELQQDDIAQARRDMIDCALPKLAKASTIEGARAVYLTCPTG